MDGKRYLYSAPVVDVKIAAPPRASRDGDKQQKEHTLLSRRAGRVNPRYPPADLVPTQPQKKIQLSKFPAVASVVSSGGVLCVPGSDGAVAGVHEGPRPISAGHTRSSRLDGGLPRAWLQRGLAKSRGVEGGLELEKLAQIDAAVCQGADGELGRELGPLMREFVQCRWLGEDGEGDGGWVGLGLGDRAT